MKSGDVAGAVPKSVVEIVPDTLFAVGWSVPADDRISWVPVEEGAWLPLQCYVLRNGDAALTVDTNVAAIADRTRQGLDAVLEGTTRVNGMVTGHNFENLGNLSWMATRYKIDQLYPTSAQSLPNSARHISSFMDAVDAANAESTIRAMSGLTLSPLPDAEPLEIGRLRLTGPRPPIRSVGSTTWGYESVTRTMFCGDAWGFGLLAEEGPTEIIRAGDPRLTRERLEAFFRMKFFWLNGSETKTLVESLHGLFGELEVDRLCPRQGCVIEGRDAVEHILEMTIAFLEGLGDEDYETVLSELPTYPRRVFKATAAGPELTTSPSEVVPDQDVFADRYPPSGRLPRKMSDEFFWASDCMTLAMPPDGTILHAHFVVFVVRMANGIYMVDTGYPEQAESLDRQLDEFLGGDQIDYIFPSHAEIPHAGLAGKWMKKYPSSVLVADGRDYHLYYPEEAAAGRIWDLRPGDALDLGDRHMLFVPAIWNDMLTSLWMFDTKLRMLYTGDAFGFLHPHTEGQCDYTTAEHQPDFDLTQRFNNGGSFFYSRYKDMRSAATDMDELIEWARPRVIAPAHGTLIDNVDEMMPFFTAAMEYNPAGIGAQRNR